MRISALNPYQNYQSQPQTRSLRDSVRNNNNNAQSLKQNTQSQPAFGVAKISTPQLMEMVSRSLQTKNFSTDTLREEARIYRLALHQLQVEKGCDDIESDLAGCVNLIAKLVNRFNEMPSLEFSANKQDELRVFPTVLTQKEEGFNRFLEQYMESKENIDNFYDVLKDTLVEALSFWRQHIC
jgi:uncharacterized phage infection (PIP) family protein YhgE